MSLYDDLGGSDAIGVALDRFYEKILADERVNGFFQHVRLDQLKPKQVAFLSMAFGGPNNYQGRDMRSAHTKTRAHGLNEPVFEIFMNHFRSTLEELGVDDDKVGQVMTIAYSAKQDVLGN